MEINSLTRKTLFHLRYLRLLVVLLCISCNLIMLVVPIYIGKAIDSLNGHNNAKSFWIILLLFVIGAVFNYFQNFLWFKLTHLGKAALRGEVFKRIMENPVSFFKAECRGDYVNRTINDTGVYASNRLISEPMLIINISTLIIGFVYLFYINIFISFFIALICVVYFASYLFINKKMRQCSKEEKETDSKLLQTTNQMFSYAKTAKYFNSEELFSKKYTELVQSLCQKSISLQKWKSLATATSTALVQMIPIFSVLLGLFFISIGKCTVGALFSIYSLSSVFDEPIRNLTDYNMGFQQAQVSKNRIEELFGERDESIHRKDLAAIDSLHCKDIKCKFDGSEKEISYDDVVIDRTTRLAIVGESGAGKSTLVRILMKDVFPNEGVVIVNNDRIDNYKTSDYYGRIAIQEQEVILYDDTVKNNILIGRSISSEDLNEIVSTLGIEDCLDKYPEQLSGGEKKRVGIARALVGDHDLLILDEPTAEIDELNEGIIIDFIDKYIKKHNMALIVITHKMGITKICNKIITV